MPGRRVHRLAQGRGGIRSNGHDYFANWKGARFGASLLYYMGDDQDATSTTLDLSGNGQDMTLLGGTSTVPGKIPGVRGYDFGGDEYMQGGTTPAIVSTGSVTAEVEFELDNLVDTHSLFQRGTDFADVNWRIRIYNGLVNFLFRNAADTNTRQWAQTSASIVAGSRYHLVFRHTFGNGSAFKCTLNGQDITGAWYGGEDDLPEENASFPHRVGFNKAGSQILDGEIYSAAVWDRYLTDAEVADLYKTTVAVRSVTDDWYDARSNADLLYFFGDAQDQTSTSLDLSGNGGDLVLAGDTSTVPSKLAGMHGYDFGGDEYMAYTGGLPAITSSMSVTLEAEFELDNVAAVHTLAIRGTAFTECNFILRAVNDKPVFVFRDVTDSSNPFWDPDSFVLVAGTRYHLVFRHTFGVASTSQMKLNGVDVAGAWSNGTGNEQPLEASLPYRVGYRAPTTQILDGRFYSLAVWDEYLTDAEAAELYTTAVAARNTT